VGMGGDGGRNGGKIKIKLMKETKSKKEYY
jgi:hypothetical protein